MAHYKLRQCRINNLTSINAFACTYITKKQTLHHSQRYTLLRKWQHVHGNVTDIANLLTSIEDKKLEIQVNYFIYHINHGSYQHSKSEEHLGSVWLTRMDHDAKTRVPISKYTHKLTNKPPVVAATRKKV